MLPSLSKVANGLGQVLLQFERLGTLPLIWILVFLQFGFLIVIRPVFPTYWEEGWTLIVLIYIVITIAFIKLTETLPTDHKVTHTTIQEGMILFPLAFMGMYIFLLVLQKTSYFITPSIPQSALILNVMLHCVIIAPSEEIMFRGALYHTLKWKMSAGSKVKRWAIPMLITSLVFSLFHLGVYGNLTVAWPLFLMAFIMSCIFCILTDYFGLVVAMACHACWNCVAIGLWFLKPELITSLLGG